jgi:glutamate-1-semialdehyde 2,1-aminomutase
MATMINTVNKETYLKVPTHSRPLNQDRIAQLLAKEWETFKSSTAGSGLENIEAAKTMPLGVASSFQHWDPYPLHIRSAKGAWMTDMDGRKLIDYSMGFGAMLVGHLHPVVMEKVKAAMEFGTMFVTPAPQTRSAADALCARFDLDQIRFTNSGTESTMYAIRTAKAATGKRGVVKVEGGYHGSYDPLTCSVKPSLEDAGPADNPTLFVPPATEPGELYVVPYNNADALEKVFKEHADTIACFVVEPVLENIAIVLPDAGYLERVRELCTEYNVILIFDEVKTGLTAGPQGASQRLGVKPDLITLAKSIGGGLPVAAFGGRKDLMDSISNHTFMHFGTFNGNPLSMAAVMAVDEICTKETMQAAEDLNNYILNSIFDIIEKHELPAHVVGFGVKGCVTWATTPVRNYRDYKATDFNIAELSWLWSMNRGVITPPGLDEQWLVSLAHGKAEADQLIENYRSLAEALRAE